MKNITLLFFLFLSLNIFAQNNWMTSFGGQSNEEIFDTDIDPAGDLIHAGYFSGTINTGLSFIQTSGYSDIMVMKTDDQGNEIWTATAGGNGPDRAYSIAVDNSGNSYITGYFFEEADFGGITVTGQDREIFVAMLDPLGNFVWVQTMGGQFGDTGYGIEVDNAGSVFCTGQYRGNATFGPDNFVSMWNPTDMEESYDIFISKLDAVTGAFIWNKDGKAKYDDRGTALTIDDAGNCYVIGEFSDTLYFDNQYNNGAPNAGFMMAVDPSGTELWFDRAMSGQTLLNDIQWKNGDLYLTGDFRGNLVWIDVNNSQTFLSAYAYNIMTVKFTDSGDLTWLSSNYSDNEVYAKKLCLDNNDDIYVAGLFKCSYTEMNETYGNSTFLSMGFRDVHYMKYANDGTFQWSRQLGSPKDIYTSSIVIKVTDHPLIAGGYEGNLNIPVASQLAGMPIKNFGISNCGDANYGKFIRRNSKGLKDWFITDPFDISRLPLDYYSQTGTCTYDTLAPCINLCADTLDFCQPGDWIYVDHFQHEYGSRPLYYYTWSNGLDTNNFWQSVTENLTLKIERWDGCVGWYDTVQVNVHDDPAKPLITDNWLINDHKHPALRIDTCTVDSLFLTASPNDTITVDIDWFDGGVPMNDSTDLILGSGLYQVAAISQYGCVDTTDIQVILDTFALQDTLDPVIYVPGWDVPTNVDSIVVCYDDFLEMKLLDSAFIDPLGLIPNKWTFWSVNGVFYDSVRHVDPNIEGIVEFPPGMFTTGWYNFSAHLVNQCADSVDYFIDRDIYINVLNPQPDIIMPTNICPGDTVMLHSVHNGVASHWSGPNIVQDYGDSCAVIVPWDSTVYQFHIDTTFNGYTCTEWDEDFLIPPPEPQVITHPADGVVCPSDSVMLESLEGIAWQWVGPTGDLLGTNQTQYVDLPGFYHCIVTLASGCVMTSNHVEVKEYSAPYLAADPGVICNNGTALIELFSPTGTVYNWLPPLSGSSTTQTVDSAGVYYIETTYCGLTILDSVTIITSNPVATLNFSGDTTMCPTDTIVVSSDPGMAFYYWNGTNGINTFNITSAGSFVLTVEDIYECQATSDTINVTLASDPSPPVISDTILCLGDDVLLIATANSSIDWYTGGTFVQSGDSLNLTNVQQSISYELYSSDSICSSFPTTVNVDINPSSQTPAILGDSVYCENDGIILMPDQFDTSTVYTWITPSGDSVTHILQYFPVTPGQSGSYGLFYQGQGCQSDTAYINIQVNALPTANVSQNGTVFICPGDSIVLDANTNGSDIYWSTADSSSTITIYSPGEYFFVADENGCQSISDTLNVAYNSTTVFTDSLDDEICEGDSVVFNLAANYSVIWLDINLDTISTANNYNTGSLDTSVIYGMIISDTSACPIPYTAVVTVHETDFTPTLTADTSLCMGTPIYAIADDLSHAEYYWLLSGDTVSYMPDVYMDTTAGAYDFTLIVGTAACYSYPAYLTVNLHDNPISDLPADTMLCYGEPLILTTPYNYTITTEENWWDVNYDSLVIVTYVDSNGCSTADSMDVWYDNCNLTQFNVFTPNGDNVNDLMLFDVPKGQVQSLIILNRWGVVVSNSTLNEWDGTDNSGSPLPSGTYFYTIEYETWDGIAKAQAGSIYLSRE